MQSCLPLEFGHLGVQSTREVGQTSACRGLQPAEGFSPTFFGFIYRQWAALKPEKFLPDRKRRPERPPAGKIACHTKRQSPGAG
jgi:hypothetical protein